MAKTITALVTALGCALIAATPVIAKTPTHTQNLYCTGGLDTGMQRLQVTLLSDNKELDVNGDVHYLKTHGEVADAKMLYTYDYIDFNGGIVYLALVSVNKGKDMGMYLVKYQAHTDEPLMIARIKCHRAKG